MKATNDFWTTRASTLLTVGLWLIGLSLLWGVLWSCGY